MPNQRATNVHTHNIAFPDALWQRAQARAADQCATCGHREETHGVVMCVYRDGCYEFKPSKVSGVVRDALEAYLEAYVEETDQ